MAQGRVSDPKQDEVRTYAGGAQSGCSGCKQGKEGGNLDGRVTIHRY